ncbi:MAG: TonB family protein [Pseudomonadota bacterium]
MRIASFKWLAALSISFFLHAGIAGFFKQGPEEILLEGGASVEIATLGSAFADTIASGDPDEIIEPTEPQPEALEPVEELTEEQVVEPLDTIQPVTSEEVDVKTSEPSELVSNETADEIRPLEEVKQTPEATIKPIETQAPEQVEVAALVPETQENAETSTVLAPTVPKIETVPVPQRRQVIKPKQEPKPKKQTKPKPKKETAKKPEPKKPAKKKAEPTKKKVAGGDRGKQKATRKSGTNTGRKDAKAKREGKKKSASRAGNAAVSNYPGKIVRKLRRSLRYPKAAKKKKIRGQVLVSFVVSRSGQVSGVRVVRGSGSSILDDAAVKAVLRAAPFPKIPENAGRSKWSFKVPLAFK